MYHFQEINYWFKYRHYTIDIWIAKQLVLCKWPEKNVKLFRNIYADMYNAFVIWEAK